MTPRWKLLRLVYMSKNMLMFGMEDLRFAFKLIGHN